MIASTSLGDKAELQWRISQPLSVLILAIFAIPLSRVAPRQGRFARLFPAIIIFIVYYNLITVSKRWVEAAVLPQYVGVWWIHLVVFILGMLLFARQHRWRLS